MTTKVHSENVIEVRETGGASFVGPKGVDVFRALAIANGLRLYAKTGMQPNRMWTPKNMMRAAAEMTGKKFKARDYLTAADALDLHAKGTATEVHAEMATAEVINKAAAK